MQAGSSHSSLPFHHHPLVPAAVVFLAGVAAGGYVGAAVGVLLGMVAALLLAYVLAEVVLTGGRRVVVTHVTLGVAILLSGVCVYRLNQRSVDAAHVARYLAGEPVPVAARLRVVAPPENAASHGNLYWVASATEIFDGRAWVPASGDVRVKSKISAEGVELHRNQVVEVYGWLKRPAVAMNPGGTDERQVLAADRIFAEIRVPRVSGVRVLAESEDGLAPLVRLRTWLRGKLLEHTARLDSEAGYSMVALLLGHRDQVIAKVNESFADAGVSHLLAISGSHIVFFTAMIWFVLRFVPMRPRRRELVVAGIVLVYIVATPCGPPVMRAAIALLMLLVSRLLGRPRQYLNMLAAAAIVIVLVRPRDLFDAGFQLTFVCTAALILFAEPVYGVMAGKWLSRRELIADLRGSRFARLQFTTVRSLLAMLAANVVGAVSAAPLVAFHFARVNPHAMFTGLIAFPFVAVTMAASALQLMLEMVNAAVAGVAAPVLTGMARVMVGVVGMLSALPGAAVALRPPPAWLVMVMYLPLVLAMFRRRLGVSRAVLVNATLAMLVAVSAWYCLSQPVGELRITALSASQGSSILLHTPKNQLVLINAGARDYPGFTRRALVPAMQQCGRESLDAMIVTSLDTLSAQYAGEAIRRYRPPVVVTSPVEWEHLGWTHAGADVEQAIGKLQLRQRSLAAGSVIKLGENATMRILWPMPKISPADHAPLVLLVEHQGRRILLLDPAVAFPLELLKEPFTCDAIVFLGPRPGTLSVPLQKIIAASRARTVVYSGRTAWAPPRNAANELNTADGSLTLTISGGGDFSVR